jgi:hypothetical protein
LVAETVGTRFVFAVTAALLLINLIWVWFTRKRLIPILRLSDR